MFYEIYKLNIANEAEYIVESYSKKQIEKMRKVHEKYYNNLYQLIINNKKYKDFFNTKIIVGGHNSQINFIHWIIANDLTAKFMVDPFGKSGISIAKKFISEGKPKYRSGIDNIDENGNVIEDDEDSCSDCGSEDSCSDCGSENEDSDEENEDSDEENENSDDENTLKSEEKQKLQIELTKINTQMLKLFNRQQEIIKILTK